MATISIADNDARIQHTISSSGNTAGSTTFPIDFPFFNLDDIDVTITNSSGVDTVISRGTGANTFSVSGTAVDDGFSGGNVILNTQYTSSTVTISRDIEISRTSDFATSGPFNISSLNTDLDKIYAVMQQLETNNARALSLPTTDTLTSITLPTNASRRGKYLAFNASTGDAEVGGSVADTGTVATISANITTVASIQADVTTVAHLQDGTTATSAISTLATKASDITTVAGQVANMTNVTDNLSAVQNAGANATKAQNYATETDSTVTGTSDDSAKSWANGGSGSYSMRTSGKGSSKEWAVYTAGTADGSDYSAKNYAIAGSALNVGSAKNWAIGGGDSFSSNTAVGNTGLYSAKYWAEQSAASKTEFSNIYQGTASSDPSGGSVSAGDLYFNSSTNRLKFYNGSAWANIEATDTSSFAQKGFAIAMAIAL
mgnify:FL=1|tara:strand:+ start:674 stop:1969 length:1296 start_codon:yes stop_codon:yes gene_type:complete